MAQIPEHRGSPGSVVVQEDAVHQNEARRRRLNTFWLLGLQVASEPTLICSLKSIQKKRCIHHQVTWIFHRQTELDSVAPGVPGLRRTHWWNGSSE